MKVFMLKLLSWYSGLLSIHEVLVIYNKESLCYLRYLENLINYFRRIFLPFSENYI